MNWMIDLDSFRKRLELSDDHDIVVPIEVGGSYMSKEMEKVHVGLNSLLDTVEVEMEVEKECKKDVGLKWYLAQFDLRQISPNLMEDIEVPDLCKTGKGDVYQSNIWLGGASGTASDCHQDPFNNLLCQLYGRKTVLLFDPASSDALYPALNSVQKNTSTIDFTGVAEGDREVDRGKYPLFYDHTKRIQYGPVTLEPGDALYIPHKYWHYVSAPGVSLSVNHFWL